MTETAARHHDRSAPEAEIVAALGRRAIVLVGMMGSGKSTIGRRLGARLHIPFSTPDHEIESPIARPDCERDLRAAWRPYFRDGEAR